jgi:hypothetical protein
MEIQLGRTLSLNKELTATRTSAEAHEGRPVFRFRSHAGKSDDVISAPTR